MKKILLLLLPAIITSLIHAQIIDMPWAHHYESPGTEIIGNLGHDEEGNIYSVGHFSEVIDFNDGPGEEILTPEIGIDGFLKKNDPDGNLIWVKQFPSAHTAFSVLEVAPDGNLFLTGFYIDSMDANPSSDEEEFIYSDSPGDGAFLMKLNADGELLWVNNYSASSASTILFESIAVGSDGNLVTIFSFFGEVNIGTEDAPILVSASSPGNSLVFFKVNAADGDLIWHKQIDGDENDYAHLALDEEDNIYLAGGFSGEVDFDPGSDEFILTETGGGFWDAFVARYTPDGDFVWAKHAVGDNHGVFGEMEVHNEGIYLVGTFSGTVDFDLTEDVFELTSGAQGYGVVVSINFDGELNWAKPIETDYHTFIYLDTDEFANLYITGVFKVEVDLDPSESTFMLEGLGPVSMGPEIQQDGYITKWNSAGEFIWGGHFPSTNFAKQLGVHVVTPEEVYVAGEFTDSLDCNPILSESEWLVSEGFKDIVLLKLSLESTVSTNGEKQIETLDIYPNPTNGLVEIILPQAENTGKLIVVNMLGEQILEKTDLGSEMTIDLNGLSKGMYTVLLLDKNGTLTHREKMILN